MQLSAYIYRYFCVHVCFSAPDSKTETQTQNISLLLLFWISAIINSWNTIRSSYANTGQCPVVVVSLVNLTQPLMCTAFANLHCNSKNCPKVTFVLCAKQEQTRHTDRHTHTCRDCIFLLYKQKGSGVAPAKQVV